MRFTAMWAATLILGCSQPTKVEPGPLTVAVVLAGQEIWIGNDTFETDPAATYRGRLRDVVDAFDQTPPALHFPADSRGVIISYATGARVVRAFGPLEGIRGEALGVQRDYRGATGSDLVRGIMLALEEIPANALGVIVVVGDGNDSNNDEARARFVEMRRVIARRGIAVHALIVTSEVSPDGEVMSVLTPNVHPVSKRSLAAVLDDVWKHAAPKKSK